MPFAQRRGGGFRELGAQSFELGDGGELGVVGGEAALGDLPGVQRAEDVWGRSHSSW